MKNVCGSPSSQSDNFKRLLLFIKLKFFFLYIYIFFELLLFNSDSKILNGVRFFLWVLFFMGR